MVPFWKAVSGGELAQGDFITACMVPYIAKGFSPLTSAQEISIRGGDLIVLTQTCDLANMKNGLVALCPIRSITKYQESNPKFANKGAWEEVRKGRREGLHLLASPTAPEIARESFVVDFREIYSLPFDYLALHAEALGSRWRLDSPFLEHFSQAFARFFMRVGLPSAVAPFHD